MAEVKGARRYSSPRREAAARATRRAVIAAAHELFVTRGYAATTIDDIARAAQVSRPTVYTVGSKADLLKVVRDVAIAGDDDPVAVPDRPSVAAVLEAPDAVAALRLHARNVADIHVRVAEVDQVLRQAADTDPDLQQLWDDAERQRHDGATLIVDSLLDKGRLRAGLDRDRAIDVLWLLMAPDHLARLRRRGWDDADYATWIADTFVRQLLP